ncbi:MAG: TauD/TfdA family dioxygenase [Xanthomonadales bacterium]|nr:TauD/TfdA family dioxygenase [Xanthomonadales bacterium]
MLAQPDLYALGAAGWQIFDLPAALEEESELERFLALWSPGRIELQTLVVEPERALLASSGRAMSLHTDNTYLDRPCRYVGLYCIEPGVGGRSLLLDGLDAIAGMHAADRERLGQRAWYWRHGRTRSVSGPHRVIDTSGEVRWWRTNLCVYDEAFLATAERLEQHLLRSPRIVSLVLERGQLLLIDNKRMLHGRTQVTSNERTMVRIRIWT